MTIIAPGSTIGIIGGGQLGRMLAMAAAAMGYKTHIFTPESDSPASHVANRTTVAQYTDKEALEDFARAVDVVTFEFENVPAESLSLMETLLPVRPRAEILFITRNRIREKTFIQQQGIGTAPFAPIRSADDLESAVQKCGLPAIFKTSEMGYDGKGQAYIRSLKDALQCWQRFQTKEAVLEGFVEFDMELSVIVARGVDGKAACYQPVHNIHKDHILDRTIVPAPISDDTSKKAEAIALKLAEALNLVGIMAVEMFHTKTGEVLVNELAPRPHNSGHWTMDAAHTSQFEQQIRAICGLPLGSTEVLCPAEMKNLIGDEVHDWQKYLQDPTAHVHIYGKAEARTGRKMGHVNFLKKPLS